jgi:hypothetical protein
MVEGSLHPNHDHLQDIGDDRYVLDDLEVSYQQQYLNFSKAAARDSIEIVHVLKMADHGPAPSAWSACHYDLLLTMPINELHVPSLDRLSTLSRDSPDSKPPLGDHPRSFSRKRRENSANMASRTTSKLKHPSPPSFPCSIMTNVDFVDPILTSTNTVTAARTSTISQMDDSIRAAISSNI